MSTKPPLNFSLETFIPDPPSDIWMRVSNFGNNRVISIYDRGKSTEHPIVLFSISEEMINPLFASLPLGTDLLIRGSLWADYQHFLETGEMPFGDSEDKAT